MGVLIATYPNGNPFSVKLVFARLARSVKTSPPPLDPIVISLGSNIRLMPSGESLSLAMKFGLIISGIAKAKATNHMMMLMTMITFRWKKIMATIRKLVYTVQLYLYWEIVWF